MTHSHIDELPHLFSNASRAQLGRLGDINGATSQDLESESTYLRMWVLQDLFPFLGSLSHVLKVRTKWGPGRDGPVLMVGRILRYSTDQALPILNYCWQPI